MRERVRQSYHARWFGRAFVAMFTTLGGIGSIVLAVALAIGPPFLRGAPPDATLDEIGPYLQLTGIFLVGAFLLQLILAPRQMERERAKESEATIASLRVELDAMRATRTPADKIRRINAHLDQIGPIWKGMKTVMQNDQPEPWTPHLRALLDWLKECGVIVEDSCVGRTSEFKNLWRSIPSEVRGVGLNADGSPHVVGGRYDTMRWIASARRLLTDCIRVLEGSPHA